MSHPVPAALLAEWTKLRSVRSDLATLVAIALLMITGTLLVVAGIDLPTCPNTCRNHPTPTALPTTAAPDGTLALVGVHFAQLAVIVLAVAVMAGEFQPRLLRLTFAMRPGRLGVFGAKAAVVAGAVAVSAAVGVPLAVFAGRMLLEHRTGVPATGPSVRAIAGTVAYLALIGLLSLGVAAAARSGPVASGVVVAALYGPYLLTLLVPLPAGTLHAIQDASPMTAGLAVQAAAAGSGTAPIGPWAGLAVLGAYTCGCLLLGAALLHRRDA